MKGIKLYPDVYFFRYGDYTYIRNTATQKDYLYNEIVFDILDCIKAGLSSEDEIIARMSEIYDAGEDELKNDIEALISEMTDEKIIRRSGRSEKYEGGEVIRDFLREYTCANHMLMSACVELTYRCNERCIHCYIDDGKPTRPELRLADYVKIFDQLKECGCSSVLITGGEPTLHPDFLEIVRYAKKVGLLVDIYTNALKIDDSLIDELILIKPNSVSFSLYGGTADVHDAITQVPGSFESSLNTIMKFKCAGLNVYIKTVVMKQNYKSYEDLLKLGKRLGIGITPALSIMPTHSGVNADKFRLLSVPEYEEIFKLEDKYNKKYTDFQISDRVEFICASGLNAISIDPFGYMHPCNACPEVLGNAKYDSIRSAWEYSDRLRYLRSLKFDDISDSCEQCPDKRWCAICIGSAQRENGDISPCRDTCMIAKAYHSVYNLMKDGVSHEEEV